MNRTQKTEVVADLEHKLKSARVALLAWQRGLTVKQSNQLRRELREAGGECRVAKNTLMKRALETAPFRLSEEWLEGQTTLVFGFDDPIALTKVVAKWAEDQAEKFSIKGAVIEGEILESGAVVTLSKTPPKDVLRAQFLGLLQAPASKLVRLLVEPGAQLARVVAAREASLNEAAGS